MPMRLRKLIGSVGVVVFLIAYAALVATLADHIPSYWLVRLVYFALAGVFWGVPLIPLLRWMNRGA